MWHNNDVEGMPLWIGFLLLPPIFKKAVPRSFVSHPTRIEFKLGIQFVTVHVTISLVKVLTLLKVTFYAQQIVTMKKKES